MCLPHFYWTVSLNSNIKGVSPIDCKKENEKNKKSNFFLLFYFHRKNSEKDGWIHVFSLNRGVKGMMLVNEMTDWAFSDRNPVWYSYIKIPQHGSRKLMSCRTLHTSDILDASPSQWRKPSQLYKKNFKPS